MPTREFIHTLAIYSSVLLAAMALLEILRDKRGYIWLRILAICALMRALLWFQGVK